MKRNTLLIILMSSCLPVAHARCAPAAPVHVLSSNTYVTEWLLCGPFPNLMDKAAGRRAGYDTDFLEAIGGEAGCRPTNGMVVTHGGVTRVFRPLGPAQGKIDLAAVYSNATYIAAYLYAEIASPVVQTGYFHLGADDGAKVYVNGALVDARYAERGLREHDTIFPVVLQRGLNPLLAKIEQGIGGYGLVLEALDRAHHAAYVTQALPATVSVDLLQSGALGEHLSVKPHTTLEAGDTLDELPVVWSVSDAAGAVVACASGVFSRATVLTVPAVRGFHRITLAAPHAGVSHQSYCLLAEDRAASVRAVRDRAGAWLRETTNETYAGWVAYLLFKAEKEGAANGCETPACVTIAHAIDECLNTMAANPLAHRRSGFEWAYRSKVDASGQPFAIFVPEGYDPGTAWPLRLSLHGMGGTHVSWVDLAQRWTQDVIEAHVLGRARAGGYTRLSEVDVLEVLAFVRAHWNVDARRIWLTGGSMGGGGTFRLATRHPHLFASARPVCGFGADLPVGNMLHVPLFSVHSDDDPTVPVTQSRLAAHALALAGGKAIQHETTGYGHAVGNWREGMAASLAWERRQVRPGNVSRVRYTAADELASGAYWARVLVWGPRAGAASFDVRAGTDNNLFITLENVGTLELDLAAAPVDRAKEMAVVVGTTIRAVLPPPLPATLYVTGDGTACTAGATAPAEPRARRHFPGGATALYHGEPLMIVWGTHGTPEANEALKRAGTLACASCAPGWMDEKEEPPMYAMLFGRLPGKPDDAVTDEDMRTHNLLLLGTAVENSIVARIAGQLPVVVSNGTVVMNDGLTYPFSGRALGLLYYNPIEPSRLVYWLACDDAATADAGVGVVRRQGRTAAASDFVLVVSNAPTLVAGRSFQPDWAWEEGYAASPLLPAELAAETGMVQLAARALSTVTSSDFALLYGDLGAPPPFVAGETRWMDVIADTPDSRAAVFTVTGARLIEVAPMISAAPASRRGGALRFFPDPAGRPIDPQRTYRIAAPTGWTIGDYAAIAGTTPRNAELIDATMADVIQNYRAFLKRHNIGYDEKYVWD
ncbi:hypothetical protein GX586_05895 [bacterium]|nr:hypothetical protein [bacterium]